MIKKVFYTVRDIAGDYAILVDTQGAENTVAMFLLPDEINIGSKLVCENFEYELVK